MHTVLSVVGDTCAGETATFLEAKPFLVQCG